MFIRYQYYKGFISLLDYNMLYELKADILKDQKNGKLDKQLVDRLIKMIQNKEESMKILSV